MSMMGCANDRSGLPCDCDDCTGVVWPAPQPLSPAAIKLLDGVSKELGKAAGEATDKMILEVFGV